MDSYSIHTQATIITGKKIGASAQFTQKGVTSKVSKVAYSSLSPEDKVKYDLFAQLVDTLAG